MSKVGLWVAGGAVAVVAAGAAGTVMSGNKIEAKMTTETRQMLDKLSPLVTVQELKYEKTFTSATRTLTLKMGCGDTSFPLTWRDRIQHGPLLGFSSVGGAVIDSEFVLADDVKAKLKEAIGLDAAPLTVHSVVSLGGDITSDMAMPSVKAKLPDGTQLTWQGLTARSVQKGASTHYDMAMPSLEMVDADIDAVDIYGLSEVMGPGVASECVESKDGPVIWEDHFYPEIINPETGEPVADGEEGELVFTTLTKEAFPVIRYRTRDLTRLLPPTSRSMRRIGKIVGRSDDMLIIRGVNMFPTQVEELVLQTEGLSGQYQIVVSRQGLLDEVEVRCEVLPTHAQADRNAIAKELQHRIKTLVGVSTRIKIGDPESVERTLVGKARRVIDQRPK